MKKETKTSSGFDLSAMFSALQTPKKSVTIQGFEFFARNMTLRETQGFFAAMNDPEIEEKMILAAIVDKDGERIFKNLKEVSSLAINVRGELAKLVGEVGFFTSDQAASFEKK